MTTIPFSLRNNIGFEDSTTYNLEQILFNKELTELIHYHISQKGSYEIPDTVEIIGIEAFARCTELTSITIPKSIKTIRCLAFNNCIGLISINIPASVTEIGYRAFGNCTGLKFIYLHGKIPVRFNLNFEIFHNIDKSNCILHVPPGSKKAYKHADQWKEFKNIKEIADFEIEKFPDCKFNNSKQAI